MTFTGNWLSTHIFKAFSQEIQQNTSSPAWEEKNRLANRSVSVFQLRQMLPTPWKISSEQKEDQHQEEHNRSRLQWNTEGDGSCLRPL